jgi:hypothetical protein
MSGSGLREWHVWISTSRTILSMAHGSHAGLASTFFPAKKKCRTKYRRLFGVGMIIVKWSFHDGTRFHQENSTCQTTMPPRKNQCVRKSGQMEWHVRISTLRTVLSMAHVSHARLASTFFPAEKKCKTKYRRLFSVGIIVVKWSFHDGTRFHQENSTCFHDGTRFHQENSTCQTTMPPRKSQCMRKTGQTEWHIRISTSYSGWNRV